MTRPYDVVSSLSAKERASIWLVVLLVVATVGACYAWNKKPVQAKGLALCGRCGITVETWKEQHQPVPRGCQIEEKL